MLPSILAIYTAFFTIVILFPSHYAFLPLSKANSPSWRYAERSLSIGNHRIRYGFGPLFSVLEDIDDEDERESFKRIAQKYLSAKFTEGLSGGAAAASEGSRERKDVEDLLREVLPPVTAQELQNEIDQLLRRISSDDKQRITKDAYIDAVLNNKYWQKAGPLVVKVIEPELISSCATECIFTHCSRNL